MKFKKKYIKVLLIILLILTMLLCCIFIKEKNTIKSKEKLEFINDDNEWSENIIYPENMALFGRNYEGELTIKDMGKSIFYVINEVIPKYYIETKKKSDDEIIEYFKENYKSIYLDMGIDSQDEFVKFINKLQDFKNEELILKDYSIERDTVKKKNNNTTAKLDINYEGEETLIINITVYNKKYTDHSSVKYTTK